MGGKAKDLTGMRFGRLTVIERGKKQTYANRAACWICQCDCGNITKPIDGRKLRNGNTKSCGCLPKEHMKEMWKDEDFRQGHSDRMREVWQDEEYRQLQTNKMREMWQDEEYRQMKSDKMREQWKDEEFRKMREDNAREHMRELWQNEDFKDNMSGENHHSWKGGITPIRDYLRNLQIVNEWANKCKQEANYTCQLTGKYRGVNTHHLYAFSSIVVDAHNTYNIKIKPQVKDYTEEELKLLEDYVEDWHKDSSNAVVLSEEAHKLFHSLYGKGDNTKEQYEEFKQRYLDGEFSDLF